MPQQLKTIVGGVPVVATMFGDSRDAVIRISRDVPAPTKSLDNYAPPSDIGYLSFRYVAEHWQMVSGSLDQLLVPNAQGAEAIVYTFLSHFFQTDEQVHYRIALVGTNKTLIQTSEGDQFVDGRA